MPQTEFAPAARSEAVVVRRQAQSVATALESMKLFDAVNDIMLVLNGDRQIVYANRNALKMLGMKDASPVLGKRPGEAVGCMRACHAPGGCGTSKFCATCGAVNAILTAQAGHPDARECSIDRGTGNAALDLLVRTTPMILAGESYIICALTDISHQKRRRALERVFFHDVLNTGVAARLMAKSLSAARLDNATAELNTLTGALDLLVQEIAGHRDLMAAESCELALHPHPFFANDLVESMAEIYRRSPMARGRTIRVETLASDVQMHSDPSLMGRVIGNLLRNALEACPEGGAITVGVGHSGDQCSFRVHNPGVMSADVQLHVFQRSFSTKGDGRGLGTYSVKLLTERYLGGTVSFESAAPEGTTFTVTYPVSVGN